MAKIAFEYDGRNQILKQIFALAITAGAKVSDLKSASKSPYNPQFVKMIKSQEGEKGVKIDVDDLWK